MHTKKILTGILSVALLTFFTGNAVADQDFRIISYTEENQEVAEERMATYFGSFGGEIKSVTDYLGISDAKFVSVEAENGAVANMIISNDTYVIENEELAEGSYITGYFDAHAPRIMIYPPQYGLEVAIVGKAENNIFVDVFDEDLVSSDGFLKLNLSEETQIISQDGQPFEGELSDRRMVVHYDVATKSIPAQTTPQKLVVLFEKAMPVMPAPIEEDPFLEDLAAMDLVVENKIIQAPKAYRNKQGFVMLPLRAIAEELGYEVGWDSEKRSVSIGRGISLTIDEDFYIYETTAPIILGCAPELTESTTFVPISFFRDVMNLNNAYVFEAQIVIDNGEKME